MIFPYLCVDLSLSEQIEHISAAAHLAIILYRLGRKDFIPTNLYIDLMIMIKMPSSAWLKPKSTILMENSG